MNNGDESPPKLTPISSTESVVNRYDASSMLTRPASWLTAKRIRIHGLLLAVCLWTTYAVDISTPGLCDRYGLVKGTDFLHFYTLGSLALRGRGDLL